MTKPTNCPQQRLVDQSYRPGVPLFPDSQFWASYWHQGQEYGYALYQVGDHIVILNDRADGLGEFEFFHLMRFMYGPDQFNDLLEATKRTSAK